MLTFKHGGYNTQELTTLYKVIGETQDSKLIKDTCLSQNHCEKCPVRNICIDLANLRAYVGNLITAKSKK